MNFPVFQYSIILLKLGHCFHLHPCPAPSTDASCKAEQFSCTIQECVDKLALKNFVICLHERWCIKIKCFITWAAQSDLTSSIVIARVDKSLLLVIVIHKYVYTHLHIFVCMCVLICVSWELLYLNSILVTFLRNQIENPGLCSFSEVLFSGVKKNNSKNKGKVWLYCHHYSFPTAIEFLRMCWNFKMGREHG